MMKVNLICYKRFIKLQDLSARFKLVWLIESMKITYNINPWWQFDEQIWCRNGITRAFNRHLKLKYFYQFSIFPDNDNQYLHFNLQHVARNSTCFRNCSSSITLDTDSFFSFAFCYHVSRAAVNHIKQLF